MDEFVDLGIDIFNPLQFTYPGIDTADVKKTYGDVMTFWGGLVDIQKVLPFGTPDEVRDQVKRQIDTLTLGGGFVTCTVHNTQHARALAAAHRGLGDEFAHGNSY